MYEFTDKPNIENIAIEHCICDEFFPPIDVFITWNGIELMGKVIKT